MGLPQLSSKIDDEAATSPRTSVQSTTHFGGVSSCDLHGLHFTSTYNGSSLAGDFPCSTIGDFQRKTTLEVPTGLEAPLGAEGMKSGSNEKNLWLVPKAKRNVQDPVSRIVGFESSGTGSFINGFERLSTDRGNTSSNIGVSDNLMDVHGLQVRKRLLSPLNGMLSPRQFNGDNLDLGRNNVFTNSGVPVGNERVFKIQGKKANIGKNGYIDAPIWSSTRCLGWSEPAADNGSNPFLFTDGPLLDNQDPCDNCLVSRGIDFCRDRSKVSTFTRAVTVSPEKVNSPLSLSPLGPTWSERMKNAEYFRVAVKDGEHCISKNMGVLLDESAPRISHSPNADERGISASNCQDIGMLGSDTEKLTPQSCPETGSKWGPESIPLPQCVKLVRSLSGASVRRSLVGSFEESLLSGRFSSGKANQRIDGFLAVLNVTGGNFIPPSQKLPFSVTSIDGDSCLLYYASIDLAGNLPSNKGRGKLKRSLSNDESRSAKSRLRVPMKGRIQLVLGFLFLKIDC
ncbi:hypothetical protein QJS10_CPA16g00875 [Acorus calamus]|uniref:Atos-like conserved domain-containing protein n=1 Tax=Acorus calamus TaxID=4465 RepID=A0AAV9D053_ACOCL|nr:hypothetical protein QJS10_CPA16g00875 [Acorus calamus]